MPRSAEHKGSGVGSEQGSVDAEISRRIVKIYTELFGRGPTKASTRRRDELVACLLEDVFGAPERILVEAGHFEQVRLNRQAVRDQVEPRVRAAVEEATGRPVEVYLGQVIEAGLACEICLLGPASTPADLRDRTPPDSPRRG